MALTQAELNEINYEDQDKLAQLINAKGIDSIRQQQQGVADIERQLAQYQNRQAQIDLTPLAGLVDAWSGSNLAKAYNRPLTQEEKDAAVFQLQQAAQKAKQGVADNELELIRAALGNQYKMKELEQSGINAQAKRIESEAIRGEQMDRKHERDIIEYGEKYTKTYGEKIEGLSELSQGLQRAKAAVERNGGNVPVNDPEYDSGVSQMITAYNKYKAGLGALAGADLNLLVKAGAADPNAIRGWLTSQIKGGGRKSVEVLDRLQQSVDKTVDNIGGYQKKIWKGYTDDLHKQYKTKYEEQKNLFNKNRQEKPATVTQGGHTYTLNPKTGEYE